MYVHIKLEKFRVIFWKLRQFPTNDFSSEWTLLDSFME